MGAGVLDRPMLRVALLCALVLGGCQPPGDVRDTALGCRTARAGGGLDAVLVDADDDVFAPACMTVPQSSATRVVVRNVGRHPHTFSIGAQGIDRHLDAGQVVFIDVDTTAGVVPYVCTLHDGMSGVLRTSQGD